MRCGLALLVLATVTSGCATVKVVPVTKNTPADAEGVRFYQPAPYLLVTDTVDGTKVTRKGEVVWLPDMSREYRTYVRPGWGTVNGTVTLADGWKLTTLGATMDSKGPETLTAITGLLPFAGVTAHAAPPPGATPTPGQPRLYRIVMDAARAEDGTPVPQLVEVPLVPSTTRVP